MGSRKNPLRAARDKRRAKLRKGKSVLCDCGKPAVTHKQVRVGYDGHYLVTLYLCQDCLKLERDFFG